MVQKLITHLRKNICSQERMSREKYKTQFTYTNHGDATILAYIFSWGIPILEFLFDIQLNVTQASYPFHIGRIPVFILFYFPPEKMSPSIFHLAQKLRDLAFPFDLGLTLLRNCLAQCSTGSIKRYCIHDLRELKHSFLFLVLLEIFRALPEKCAPIVFRHSAYRISHISIHFIILNHRTLIRLMM